MSSLFKTPKMPAQTVVEEEPPLVDNSETVKAEESRRKKRRGAASQIVSLGKSASDNGAKTTLGQ